MRNWMIGGVLGLAAALAGSTTASAQSDGARVRRHAPLRVQVTPAGRLFRQCADWHVIERRPSGDTVTPRTQCWWAVR